MKSLLMDIRVWPNNDKKTGDKIDIAKGQYTELTTINLDSGKVELYNVESEVYKTWEVTKAEFSILKTDNPCPILEFETATKYGKTKIVDCTRTDESTAIGS